jgi:hypothetical protein
VRPAWRWWSLMRRGRPRQIIDGCSSCSACLDWLARQFLVQGANMSTELIYLNGGGKTCSRTARGYPTRKVAKPRVELPAGRMMEMVQFAIRPAKRRDRSDRRRGGPAVGAASPLHDSSQNSAKADLTVMLLGHRQRINRAGCVPCASRGPAIPIPTWPG